MPLTLFASLLIVWVTTLLIDRRFRRLRAARIGAIGRPARMNFAAVDRFDLHDRLLADEAWRDAAANLEVKDVLYGTAGVERCFIFTAKFRPSLDVPHRRRLTRLVESTRDGSIVETITRDSADARTDENVYQRLVDGWLTRHADA